MASSQKHPMSETKISASSAIDELVAEVRNLLDNSSTLPYQLLHFLQQERGNSFTSPLDIRDTNGNTLVHMCLKTSRVDLLCVILYMGWWRCLYGCKEDSAVSNETFHIPGVTSDAKRELERLCDLESSQSDCMIEARRGDARAVQNMPLEGGALDANNDSTSYWSVVSGNLPTFRALIAKGYNPFHRNASRQSLLHVAVEFAGPEFIRELKDLGLEEHSGDAEGKLPVERAAEMGHVESFKEFKEIDPKTKVSCMSLAAYNGRNALISFMLECGEYDIDGRDNEGRTMLTWAIEGNHIETIRLLLQKGANPSLKTKRGRNILHILARFGTETTHRAIAPFIQANGVLGNLINGKDKLDEFEQCHTFRDSKGKHCIRVKRHLLTKFMKHVQSHADLPDSTEFGEFLTPPNEDTPDEQLQRILWKLYKRSRRRLETAIPDSTPLHDASRLGNVGVAEFLITTGANVHERDAFGLTPLMLAAVFNQTAMVQLLEKHGARHSDCTEEGLNAAQLAEMNGNQDITRYLHEKQKCIDLCLKIKRECTEQLENDLNPTRLQSFNLQDLQKNAITTMRKQAVLINQGLQDLGASRISEPTDDNTRYEFIL